MPNRISSADPPRRIARQPDVRQREHARLPAVEAAAFRPVSHYFLLDCGDPFQEYVCLTSAGLVPPTQIM